MFYHSTTLSLSPFVDFAPTSIAHNHPNNLAHIPTAPKHTEKQCIVVIDENISFKKWVQQKIIKFIFLKEKKEEEELKKYICKKTTTVASISICIASIYNSFFTFSGRLCHFGNNSEQTNFKIPAPCFNVLEAFTWSPTLAWFRATLLCNKP